MSQASELLIVTLVVKRVGALLVAANHLHLIGRRQNWRGCGHDVLCFRPRGGWSSYDGTLVQRVGSNRSLIRLFGVQRAAQGEGNLALALRQRELLRIVGMKPAG